MWLMTTRGFYSTVQHYDDPTKVVVRARCQEDIDALGDLLTDEHDRPFETLDADYRWRLVTTASKWAAVVAQLALEVDYPNFKNEVEDKKHKAAYTEVWYALLALDQSRYGSPWHDEPWYNADGDPYPAKEDDLPITFVSYLEDDEPTTAQGSDPLPPAA